jgi:small-conductance mechanosensitive channel
VQSLQSLPHVLIGLGAIAGIVAAGGWLRRSQGARVSSADFATGLALGLASLGYLLGRFTGSF